MRIDKPKRSRKSAKRLDLTDMREALRDRRQWSAVGLIVAPTDGSPHWRVHSEDGTDVDVLVEVVLQPSQEQITARLAGGMWTVPDLGEEVIVIVPAGRTDFMPTIVAVLSSNVVPSGQGPQPDRTVIVRNEVVVHDGSGGAQPLANQTYRTNEDTLLNALKTAFLAIQIYANTVAALPAPFPATAAAATALNLAIGTPVGPAPSILALAYTAFNSGAPNYLTTVLKGK